jgi:hypothetical protein
VLRESVGGWKIPDLMMQWKEFIPNCHIMKKADPVLVKTDFKSLYLKFSIDRILGCLAITPNDATSGL